jgi:hypothetical protein
MFKRYLNVFSLPLYLNQPGEGFGGGAPAGGGAGAPAGSPPAAPAGGAPPAAAGGGAPASGSGGGAGAPGGTPAGGGATQYSYQEDRSQWIPPHRLNEVNQRYQALHGRFQEQERRVRALLGVDEASRRDPQTDAIRQQFFQVMPELAPLAQNPQQLNQLLQLVQSGQLNEILGTMQSYWGRHAQTTARDLVSQYAKAINVDPSTIPPRAVQRMAMHLKSFIEEDQTGERQMRFEHGDPRLVEECLADVQGLFVEPVRRSTNVGAAQNVERNRQLPNQGPRGAVPPQGGGQQPRSRAETREAARQFVLNNK